MLAHPVFLRYWARSEARKVTPSPLRCFQIKCVDSSNLQKSRQVLKYGFGFQFSSHFSVEMILFLKRASSTAVDAKPKKLKNVKITRKMMIRWILKIGFRLTHSCSYATEISAAVESFECKSHQLFFKEMNT